MIRKDTTQPGDYDVPSFVPPEELSDGQRAVQREHSHRTRNAATDRNYRDEDDRNPGNFIRVTD
jgi:hypothetical protein